MRAWPLLALALLAPTAAATVSVASIDVPPRTAGDLVFALNVTLTNDGAADRSVVLLAALYDHADGSTCGPATDPRFRAFTQLTQERVEVPAGATIRHDDWQQRYRSSDAPASPTLDDLCVFVANDTAGTARIDYESFAIARLSVRAQDAPPEAGFTWDPERPAPAQDVSFHARASDAEGDPVSFAWEIDGARLAGAEITRALYPAGDHVVTLVASDGLLDARVSHTLSVASGPSGGSARGIPFDGWPCILGIASAGALAARRRPSR